MRAIFVIARESSSGLARRDTIRAYALAGCIPGRRQAALFCEVPDVICVCHTGAAPEGRLRLNTDHSALTASFARLSATIAAEVGVAVASSDRVEVYSFGSWIRGVAWSTIKVPLAVAAMRADRQCAEQLVVKAITESDNPASEALWSQLGEPVDAARLVQRVVAAAGDCETLVESRRLRAGFTAFGQTQWSLRQQARFAANLGALPEAAPVLELMRQLVPEHRWGLASKGIATKGGWGPGPDDGYLVRQFGVVPVAADRRLGVALSAQGRTFDECVNVVGLLTEWLYSHLAQLSEQ